MSYDLVVFDPTVAPSSRGEFEQWFGKITEWEEPRDYNVPDPCSPSLKSWYLDMILKFPAMNGPYAKRADSIDDPAVSDYCITERLIYVAFAWSKALAAYEACFSLAAKHGLGFFDVSGEKGEVWLPDVRGNLSIASTSA